MQAKRGMWLWTLVTAVGLASICSPLLAAEKSPSEDKVAVVNGSIITQADFDREMRVAQRSFSRMGMGTPASQLPEIKKRVLDRLIESELLYQESQKKGFKIDTAELDEAFKKMVPQDEAKYKDLLNRMGTTEAALKSQFARGQARQKLIDKEIMQKITVSDKEIRDYYDSHPERFKQPEQVRASHILIKVDSQADASQKAEARKQLEEIQQKLKKGEDFSALAKASSQCPSSAQGGDLNYFRRGQMVKPFEEAAFSLKPGEVSDIVETQFGYHLIKVVDKKAEGTTPYEEAKGQIEQRLKKEKFQEEFTSYIAKLKEKAKVERFLKEATEEAPKEEEGTH
jgi:peptidyl-prolyl cis-trans isomerase C